jgi:hypothetical protein
VLGERRTHPLCIPRPPLTMLLKPFRAHFLEAWHKVWVDGLVQLPVLPVLSWRRLLHGPARHRGGPRQLDRAWQAGERTKIEVLTRQWRRSRAVADRPSEVLLRASPLLAQKRLMAMPGAQRMTGGMMQSYGALVSSPSALDLDQGVEPWRHEPHSPRLLTPSPQAAMMKQQVPPPHASGSAGPSAEGQGDAADQHAAG